MCKRYKQVFHRETRNVLRLALIWGAMPGLHCCAGSSLAVAGGGGYSLVAVGGCLTAVASLVSEQGVYGTWAQ